MKLTLRIRRSLKFALAGTLCFAVPAIGQQCPQADAKGSDTTSVVRTLEGTLVFHDSIRKWFELTLDKPQCEQSSIQLVPAHQDYEPMEILRGCRVRSTGTIDFSPTGYYSLDTYQSVDRIKPVGACTKQPLFPDYSKETPDKAVREYRVDMRLDYRPGDHPLRFRVSSQGKDLAPWQAYASYMLTGGDVLYGYCGKGFEVDNVFGPPKAWPSHFMQRGDPFDAAAFDAETAAAAGKKYLELAYTCVRKREP